MIYLCITLHASRPGGAPAAIRGGLPRGGRTDPPGQDRSFRPSRTAIRSVATACRWTGSSGSDTTWRSWRCATRSSCSSCDGWQQSVGVQAEIAAAQAPWASRCHSSTQPTRWMGMMKRLSCELSFGVVYGNVDSLNRRSE